MKKKLLWVLPCLFLAGGCFSNNKDLTCTISEPYDEIPTEIKITTKFKKGKAISSYGTATMQFESAEAAQSYYDAFEDDRSSLTIDGNKLVIKTEQSFDDKDEPKSRTETQAYFENSGYTCK